MKQALYLHSKYSTDTKQTRKLEGRDRETNGGWGGGGEHIYNIYTSLPFSHCFGYLMYDTDLLTRDQTVIRSLKQNKGTKLLCEMRHFPGFHKHEHFVKALLYFYQWASNAHPGLFLWSESHWISVTQDSLTIKSSSTAGLIPTPICCTTTDVCFTAPTTYFTTTPICFTKRQLFCDGC